MSTPDITLATYMGTNIGALTLGTNLFHGPIMPADSYVPVKAVFVLSDGGVMIGNLGQTDVNKDQVVGIWIRSDKDDFASGRDLGRAIISAVHYAALSGYLDCLVKTTDPEYMRADPEGRHIHYIRTELIIKESP